MNKRGMDAVGFIGITIIVVAIIVLSLGGLNNVWAQIKAIMGGGDTVETVISQCSFACSRGGKSGSWAYCSIKRPMMDTTSKKRYSGTCNEYANAGSFFSQFFLCDNTEIKCAATSLCGNGRIDSGEECDQNDLGANIFSEEKLISGECTQLSSLGFSEGYISCDSCKMNFEACIIKIVPIDTVISKIESATSLPAGSKNILECKNNLAKSCKITDSQDKSLELAKIRIISVIKDCNGKDISPGEYSLKSVMKTSSSSFPVKYFISVSGADYCVTPEQVAFISWSI